MNILPPDSAQKKTKKKVPWCSCDVGFPFEWKNLQGLGRRFLSFNYHYINICTYWFYFNCRSTYNCRPSARARHSVGTNEYKLSTYVHAHRREVRICDIKLFFMLVLAFAHTLKKQKKWIHYLSFSNFIYYNIVYSIFLFRQMEGVSASGNPIGCRKAFNKCWSLWKGLSTNRIASQSNVCLWHESRLVR